MKERVKAALEKFDAGYDCSHSILSAYADLFEFDDQSVQTIQRPCGPMTGRAMSVCGAVAGAIKALNQKLREEREAGNDTAKKSEMIREFRERFEKLHGTVSCTELLGVDISQMDGQEIALEQDLFRTKCHAFVTDAAEILEDLIDIKLRDE
jgi:C_GCAxxG_C_C family probable redox protein